jgi:hypothetical protein
VSAVDVERLEREGKSVALAALRCYLVWVAVFVSSGVRDGDPEEWLVLTGCVVIALAFIGSLVFLVWREVRG